MSAMIQRFSLIALLALLAVTPCRADEQTKEWVIPSFASSEFQRDRFIDLVESEDSSLQQLQLAPTYQISDNMARSSKVIDELSEGESAKKIFHLDSIPDAVRVLVYAGWDKHTPPGKFEINGHPYQHKRDKEKMLTGGWDRFTIRREQLKQGVNEIVFHGPCALWLDEDTSSGNSFKRLSPESEWRTDNLGPDDEGTGEWMIRFRVQGHPSEGTMVSPVIDLNQRSESADTVGDPHPDISPLFEIESIKNSFVSKAPEGTAIQYEVRTGSTPEFDPATWTQWFPSNDWEDQTKGRFVQWRATLASGETEETPSVSQLNFHVRAKELGANFEKIKMTEAPDKEVKKSSYDFTYADPNHPLMRHLREKYNFEQIAAPGKTDAEKFMLISQWIREQWEGWDMGEYDYCPQWDALQILELAPAKLALGMCTHYAATFVQAAASLGYPARSVIVDHHCLAEAWSDYYGKWMFVDTGLLANNPIALKYVDENGIPLNALELHERYLKGDASDVTVIPDPSKSTKHFWKDYLNLYCRFGIPLRNDHLYNPMPQELEHGHMQYHWDGYLWWTDSLDPKYPEYSLLTNRPEDFYWTMNKTVIDLEDTLEEGKIRVMLHGPIPNLDKFQVKKNGGEWMDAESDFIWEIEPGENTLEARAVNTMEIVHPASELVLEYTP
ncbi:MAG: transglutaminase domain-containing protein [Candidatus Omnitrophica bacterium]|nr:transglutaminase domain-containing protein [Candidatus Omnitrophota bacterium]